MVTAGFLWMSGDIMAQWLENRLGPAVTAHAATGMLVDDDNDVGGDDDATYATSSSDVSHAEIGMGNAVEIEQMPSSSPATAEANPLDWDRTRIQALYAAFIWGPFGHYWYKWLDRTALSMAPPEGSALFVGLKLFLEIIFLHPVALTVFFVCVGLMGKERLGDILQQLRSDFVPSLLLEYMLWIPCDIAMFSFIPVRHQLLVVNAICLIESVMLSYIKSNGISLPGHGHSAEGKKKDEYRQVNVEDVDGEEQDDVFGDQYKPRLLPSIQQRMRGWRRRKTPQLLV
jgi:protein Mpv17